MLHRFLAILYLLTALPANAGLIEYNGFSLQESSNIVSGNDLEWLQWDVTLNQSYQTVSASVIDTYDGGGWRYANQNEVASLFAIFFSGYGQSWSSNNRFQSPHDVGDDIANDLEKQFVTLFGSAYPPLSFGATENDPYEVIRGVSIVDNSRVTSGSFILDGIHAYVADDLVENQSTPSDNVVELNTGSWGRREYLSDTGHILVRDVSLDATPVPEPSTVMLLISALMAVRLRALRQ